jgi:hypothetical protein
MFLINNQKVEEGRRKEPFMGKGANHVCTLENPIHFDLAINPPKTEHSALRATR